MPKIVEFPLASFDRVLKLADTVDYLGGSCTIQDCAAAMKKKVTGGFGILISSAIKHDLIIRRRDRLLVTDLYSKIKYSYNTAEKLHNQQVAFLHPALYKKIYERFHNKELPAGMLDKLMIREFQVEAQVSEKIAGFFLEGVKQLDMLKEGRLVELQPVESGDSAPTPPPPPAKKQAEMIFKEEVSTPVPEKKPEPAEQIRKTDQGASQYIVSVKGQGIDSTIVVHDQDDFVILEALLGKIRKSL